MSPEVEKLFRRLTHKVNVALCARPIIELLTEYARAEGIQRPFSHSIATEATIELFSTMPPNIEEIIRERYRVNRLELMSFVIRELECADKSDT